MFPKRMWVLPTVALVLALVLTTVFASAVQAQGGTPAGEFCIKGIVIDWEEEPLGGLTVTVINPLGVSFTDVSDTDEEDEGEFEFEVGEVYSDTNGVNQTFAAVPGVYEASVEVPPGWEGVTPTTFQFEIEAGRDDCINIRFKLRQVVPVTVIKMDADQNRLPGWTIDAIPGPGNLFAEPQSETTRGGDINDPLRGTVVFTLTPGLWIFSERQPEPSDDGDHPDRYRPELPPGGQTTLDVEWIDPTADPQPAPYVVVFKNEFLDNGCVVIKKWWGPIPDDGGTVEQVGALQQVGPSVGAAGWGFHIEMTDGTVFAQGVTDAEGILVFRNLPYGPYTVVEEDRPGWAEISDPEVDVNVFSGDCVPLQFSNEQDDSGFCIEGYKLDANDLAPIAGWEIEVNPVHEGGWDVEDESSFYEDPNTPEDDDRYYLEDNKFVTDGEGKYVIRFPDNDYRIPGQQFEICEDIEDADGWLPHTPTCQIVTLPDHPSACVQAEDFINEQVGHSESEKMKDHQDDKSWEDMPAGMGGPGGHDGGAQCKNSHVVKPGETLFTIGDSYHVSPQAMVDANPSVRSTPDFWVYVGQTLCIP